MKTILLTNKQRERRRNHVRSVLRRTADRPRLSVHRSSKHISGQVIDDEAGRTLVALSSTSKKLADQLAGKNKTERAHLLGKELAARAKEAGIEKVVFDRGHFRYHGRVKAFADGAREGGLQF